LADETMILGLNKMDL